MRSSRSLHLLFLLSGSLLVTAGCATTSADEEDPGQVDGEVRTRKAIREALRTTCKTASGEAHGIDFFYDDDSQLRAALRGVAPVELATVPARDLPEDLRALGSDWAVLKGASGPTIVAERFITRYITAEDATFRARHDKVKIIDAGGTTAEATCTVDDATSTSAEAITTVLSAIPAGDYQGRGRTRAALCAIRVAREDAKLTISLLQRSADGTTGRTLSSFTLDGTSQVRHTLASPKNDVLFVEAQTGGKVRALVVDKTAGPQPLYRVTISSSGNGGTSTGYCDMDTPSP